MTTRKYWPVFAFMAAGCMPYPIQSPRVEPGVTLGVVAGVRALVRDSSFNGDSPRKTLFWPEAALSPSIGFARDDGKGPALRATGTIGLPGPWGADVYAQLPPVGSLIGGAGTLLNSIATANEWRLSKLSPYAMLGWQWANGTTLYASAAMLSAHGPVLQPDSTSSSGFTRVTGHVTSQVMSIALQQRFAEPFGMGSTTRRVFVAVYRGNRGIESIGGFDGGSVPLRSTVVAGYSFDGTRPWSWFSQSDSPRRRPRR